MGIWIKRPTVAGSETVVWKHLANRTQSAHRAVGGCLYLTGSRLFFEPNRVDSVTGGLPWSAPLSEIHSAGRQPRDGSKFNGGLRDRLRLELADGGVELFVVNKLDQVIDVIRAAIAHPA